MQETYIEVMLQSLRKKELILDRIIELDELQKDALVNQGIKPDDFDIIVEQKSNCINELNLLDEGFQEIFNKISDEIDKNRALYAEEIRQMQESIRRITDKSVQIQAQEARNKELMKKKFSTIRRQVKDIRTNQGALKRYNQAMKKVEYIDPQFLDNKK
ncbi:flagellar export chaperone FlgN [Lachnobacterium bovis]|uniref:FlgN protein n=1 Tax=Lachnobacterium bovis TaxID=140626 RepID=A0A1H9SG54_9FIRM|nr:flagellar export chaperone FlgN [Lachnobacterium bovis]SER83363.1 FlgN protein [Lachnobacterium bovis]